MTTKNFDWQRIYALFPICACAILTLVFSWCVVYGIWNINSNANGHTPTFVFGIRMFAILFIGTGAALMGIITFVAVHRYRVMRKQTML